jgi:hypothetical protein
MSIQIISRLQSISHSGPGLEDVRRELERGARLAEQGERVSVSFVVTFGRVRNYSKRGQPQAGSVTLFQHGYDPRRVLEQAEESGSLGAVLTAFANEKPGVSNAQGIAHVEMLLFPVLSRAK